ncbi:inactive transglutaminase family protein [Orbus sturtevantii]|uniref:inactive transglutaminase family protein n=1 Tax=Orbus sturtevantii TaxID=3074109 RepID=UPI00370DD0F2
MRSLTLHLKIAITILLALGVAIIGYQIFVLKTPLTESEVDNLWTIDAKINFEVNGSKPVNVELYIPPKSGDYSVSNELFLASGYGQNITNQQFNRLVTWSARSVSGQQTLFYRLNLTKRFSDEIENSVRGDIWRAPIAVAGPEKVAVEKLVKEIRSKSANVATFITTTINMINDTSNSDVQLLLNNNNSIENKVKVIELVLSQAYIPIQQAHTLLLSKSTNQTPILWIRSYIQTNKSIDNRDSSNNGDGGSWYYFNPINGDVGLPDDQVVWWVGSNNIVNVENGSKVRVNFSLDKSELTAINLAKLTAEGNSLTEYSFYTLPISTQLAYQIMLMIPFGVLIILLLRNVVGVNTLGTFTPVLVALAFRETGLVFGVVFFSIIVFFGLLLRSYLEHLKLQMLPRLSIVLTFVVLLIIFVGLFSHKLGLERGLSISLFPMVILTMTIERLSITWEERGASFALKVAIGTLITASIAYAVMGYQPLAYLVFTFPAILLLLIAFMLAMGRYRGYRLLELFRFKAMLK